MRSLYAFCLLCLIAFTSCEEEQVYKTCVVENPVQELEWLRVKVSELQKSEYCQFVQTGNFKGRTVFVVGNCDPLINSINSVYDCDGNLLCYGGDETCPNFQQEVKDVKLVWTNGK
ncbi:DUF6970 domain-containing protein [Rufibacter tibetensis]|uniref:DUF6970 domain-containing protein n=1 Tax=Rufibacter tibetensis TaxID=512763 RepID=A0A0P0CY75_9BACT|nr:hypothetical protein [Rufibacter tibetensis]ALI99417.1 hypothetical protein DC20_11135 [Rufibacter tibetensis]